MLQAHKEKITKQVLEITSHENYAVVFLVLWLLLFLLFLPILLKGRTGLAFFVLVGQWACYWAFSDSWKKASILKRELWEIYRFDYKEYRRRYIQKLRNK